MIQPNLTYSLLILKPSFPLASAFINFSKSPAVETIPPAACRWVARCSWHWGPWIDSYQHKQGKTWPLGLCMNTSTKGLTTVDKTQVWWTKPTYNPTALQLFRCNMLLRAFSVRRLRQKLEGMAGPTSMNVSDRIISQPAVEDTLFPLKSTSLCVQCL